MTVEPAPQKPDNPALRLSDADRERVVGWLSTALSEGRLTLVEFEERVDAVLRARTYAEVEPHLADLPVAATSVGRPVQDVVELRSVASNLKRRGRWAVPRRLVVRNKAGNVRLDFAEAVIQHPVVEIDVQVHAGNVKLILPHGATADIDGVQVLAGDAKLKVPAGYDVPDRGPHFVVTGSLKAGNLKVRYRRRFWRWSW
ncbi:DUF1707 domain-containing protein [Planosporangium thailandense]|uniref:DUF1707 domain-containing protein n=1 Tax=Planosporangium thailandense TaxID=765197 RepID=A0ABX0XSA7_9ACTN|nr:DUF1707 domain-containing protein [Planosporangium thailandense]